MTEELDKQISLIKKHQVELSKRIVAKKRESYRKLQDLLRRLDCEERKLEDEERERMNPKPEKPYRIKAEVIE